MKGKKVRADKIITKRKRSHKYTVIKKTAITASDNSSFRPPEDELIPEPKTRTGLPGKSIDKLIEELPLAFLTISENGTIVNANHAAATLFGEGENDLINQPLTRFILPDDHDIFYSNEKRIFENPGGVTLELRIFNRQGEPVWIEMHTTLSRDKDGAPVCSAMLVNISTLKAVTKALEHKNNELVMIKNRMEQMISDQERSRLVLLSILEDEQISRQVLRESEELFRRLFENHSAVKLIIDPETACILDANAAAAEFYGWSRDELKKMSLYQINTLPPEELIQDFEKVKTKKRVHFQFRHRISDGSVRDVEVYSSKITAKGKDLVHSIIHDITERKKAENELLLRSAAMDNAANAIMITDSDGIIQYINPAFRDLSGYNAEETIGKNPRDIIKSGNHTPHFYKTMWDTIISGNTWRGEITNKRKDGSLYPEEMTIAPVKNAAGDIRNFVAIKQDITDRKFALELLETRLELINYADGHSQAEILAKTLSEVEKFTESTDSSFHFVGEDQKTFFRQACSPGSNTGDYRTAGEDLHYDAEKDAAWSDCLRYKKPIVLNDHTSPPYSENVPERHSTFTRELIIPVVRNSKVRAVLIVGNKPKNYTDRDVSVTEYLAGITWDVIEKKKAEEYLQKMNAELELRVAERTAELAKANKELESFSYSVSHDLRAPLRHLTGFLEMFRKEAGSSADEKLSHYMDVINASAKRMGQLIEDLLKFSRMGRTALVMNTINMDNLFEEVLMDFSGEIQAGKISVTKHPLLGITGDRAMLRVVITNLLSNAIKFTSKTVNPEIEIGCDADGQYSTFYVRDNGAGFDMNYAGKLFGVFQRLHTEYDFEGTGIGLATVQNIIQRHGGSIRAQGQPGKGACFYFTLHAKNGYEEMKL